MFNYTELDNNEFEYLCKDIIEKILETRLRIFAAGRDGGVDLTDSTITHNIVVQAKHYKNSKYSDLKTALKKEKYKVEKLKPKKYYICVGMMLTDSNIREIYNMFSDYMESDKNIITLKEIDDFLQNKNNIYILRKHYKLWLHSSNILNEIYNNNIFIDCETLLQSIEEESNFYVSTNVYVKCFQCIDRNGIILITGSPGVGKTITSKMLVLYYATQGYSVRYTTNGNISDLKKSLSRDSKEIILLDDCLGQNYYNMSSNQESELISLISHVKYNNNKKLILNSRITILNEAKERSADFNKIISEEKVINYTIDMNEVELVEKAKIFYNHLLYKNVPKLYYENIKLDKNYFKIITHNNYTPRIIEYVTSKINYSPVSSSEYYNFVLDCLNNPENIWKNEYERRLQKIDRIFLTTLYSLTDTDVKYEVLEKCFNFRIIRTKENDMTLNQFEITLNRLNESFVKIVLKNKVRYIGVINPSVNDFLKNIVKENKLEINSLQESVCNYVQIKRCHSNLEVKDKYREIIINKNIVDIEFDTYNHKLYFIASVVCEYNIKEDFYKDYIMDFLYHTDIFYLNDEDLLSYADIIDKIFSTDLFAFYEIDGFLKVEKNIETILNGLVLELDWLLFWINEIRRFYNHIEINFSWIESLITNLIKESIISYVEGLDVLDYVDSHDINNEIKNNTDVYEYEYFTKTEVDKDRVVENIKNNIKSDINSEILEKLDDYNIKMPSDFDTRLLININTYDIERAIDSYLEPDYDYDYDGYNSKNANDNSYISEIESIFER